MSNILVKDISRALLAKVNYAAQMAGKTQRDWVIQVLTKAAGMKEPEVRKVVEAVEVAKEVTVAKVAEEEATMDLRVPHVARTCIIQNCGMCKATGMKDPIRGI